MVDRVTETPTTTVVETRRGGGGTILIALVLLIAVAVGAFYLFNKSQNDTIRTDAVVGAADAVSDTAKKAGDAVDPAKK